LRPDGGSRRAAAAAASGAWRSLPLLAAAPASGPRFRGAPPPPPEPPVDFSGDKSHVVDGEMDMTPMVDVVFNLLIFFMVTAAFSLQKSIEIPKPQESDQPSTQVVEIEDNPDFVTILVDEFNTFQVITPEWEKECPSQQELLVQLREAKQGSGGVVPTKVLVKAHGDALHERVVIALDSASAVKFEEVQLMTYEDDI
jgi:biopolymer transport protein ExbD